MDKDERNKGYIQKKKFKLKEIGNPEILSNFTFENNIVDSMLQFIVCHKSGKSFFSKCGVIAKTPYDCQNCSASNILNAVYMGNMHTAEVTIPLLVPDAFIGTAAYAKITIKAKFR